MVNVENDTEYLLTLKTAEEYRSKGYEVLRDAALDFLPGYRVDLLVRKGNEVKVIEVKTRSSLAADPKIAQLARLIETRPGWDFELLLVAEPEKVASPDGARAFDKTKISSRLEEARKSLDAGLAEAAFLLAWSACEAVIRELLTYEGVSNDTITKTGFVLDQGVFHGVLSRNEYDTLTRFGKYRNAIVHGFGIDDFNGELVRDLIKTVERIVRSATLVDRSNGQASSID
jgi:hypothetical protein